MQKLEKYKKRAPIKGDSVLTSVNIEVKHKTFILSNNLNLSEMVRDMLDAIMGKIKK